MRRSHNYRPSDSSSVLFLFPPHTDCCSPPPTFSSRNWCSKLCKAFLSYTVQPSQPSAVQYVCNGLQIVLSDCIRGHRSDWIKVVDLQRSESAHFSVSNLDSDYPFILDMSLLLCPFYRFTGKSGQGVLHPLVFLLAHFLNYFAH